MPKVAILYIALGRYIVFWRDFYESCQDKLMNCEKHYFVWTDNPDFDYANAKNVTVISAQKRGWPYDTLLRFEMFLQQEKQLKKFDFVYFFNANMQFINPTDLAEIAPAEWNDGLVAGCHPGRPWAFENPDVLPYERREQSTAYIPYGSGKYYVCGAFNGGTASEYLKMCKTLAKNIRTDLEKDIIARVDDESHLNWYMLQHNFRFLGRAYGYPEGKMKHLHDPQDRSMIKIISRHKEDPKYGGKRYLRGETDRKAPNNWFVRHVLIPGCRVIAVFIPVHKYRSRVRGYFGS